MAKEPTEEELNLRRKARRRLVGAVVLTLAAVVILPMVLENEPRPTVQDIDLRIPAPDKAGEFVPAVAVPPEAPVEPKVIEASGGSAASAIETASVVQAATATPAAPAAKASETAKAPEAAKTPEAVKQDKQAVAEAFVVQVGAYSNATTAKQEFDKLKGWGFKMAYTEKTGDKVRVRVGPYAERAKAEKVREMLEKHGLQPVIMGTP